VGQAALVRQRVAEDRLAMIDRRLVELEAMTEQDLAEACAREVELTDLLRWVEDTQPELAALEAEARDQQAEAGRQQAMLAAVRSLRLPEDIDAAREQVAAFRTEEEHAANALEAARSAVADLAEQRAALPAKTQITAWVEAHHALGSARAELERAAPVAVEMRERLLTASTALAEAREAFGAAADADRAAHLRLGLKVGDPCPVCGQAIATIPGAAPETAAEEAQATLTRAELREAEARVAQAQADNLVQRLQDRIADLTSQLDQVAALDELAALAGTVEAHEKSSTEAQAALAAARERLEEIAKSRQMTVARESAIRGKLQAAWSRVAQAGLEPPPLELEDVFRSWRQLEEWRASAEPRVAESAEKASALVDEVGARRRLVAEAITRRLESLAVRMGTSPPRDAVFDALSVVKGRRQQIEDALAEALARTAERESVAFEQQLARRLNLELRADHFKQWLFDEVFASLVAGANVRLGDLTRGQYQLVMEGRDFEVVDNLSAGSRRSVRTLSGGETFLVSLALALALAEQVAETALGPFESAGRLDSFFLDEGFGTLDAESLDVVAAVIAELGASGKTVGIVTHVVELAEQMPVRYVISKHVDGALVNTVRQ
jgi:exonuclease SbcC